MYGALQSMAADPTHVTGMTNHFSTILAAYGDVQELDGGPGIDYCDASDIDAGEAGM